MGVEDANTVIKFLPTVEFGFMITLFLMLCIAKESITSFSQTPGCFTKELKLSVTIFALYTENNFNLFSYMIIS